MFLSLRCATHHTYPRLAAFTHLSSYRTFSTSLTRSLAEASSPTPTTAEATTVTPAAAPAKTLHGTVGHHNLYLLLYTSQPPLTYPSKKSSPLLRALTLKFSRWGTVNWGYREDLINTLPKTWEPTISGTGAGALGEENQVQVQEEPTRIEDEVYRATAYSSALPSGVLEIPRLSVDNMDEVQRVLQGKIMPHADPSINEPLPPASPTPASESDSSSSLSPGEEEHDEIHLYVCTHAKRDCRCGDMGGAVYRAMRDEVKKRGMEGKVKVGEVGHVGGHAWAANMLVYPHGEWLGLLKPEDAPSVLDSILALPKRPVAPDAEPLCPPHWRGRQGLSKAEQLQLVGLVL